MKRRRAFSLIETTLATVVVAALLVATLNGVGSVARDRAATSDRAQAEPLAQRLLEEILALPYNDPQSASCPLGPAAGEVTGNRSLFDNVGDYHNWTETAPTNKDGTAVAASAALSRTVTLARVKPASPKTTCPVDEGALLITVKVCRGDRPVATVHAVRTRAFDSAVLTPPNTTGTRTTGTVAAMAEAF